jgi:hypothetical protein
VAVVFRQKLTRRSRDDLPRRGGADGAHAPAAEERNAASRTGRTKITRKRRMNQRLRFGRFRPLKTG